MNTIYKIYNNSNWFYTMLSFVYRWYMQNKCHHTWRLKPVGTMEHDYAITIEVRCIKCKKVEYTQYLK